MNKRICTLSPAYPQQIWSCNTKSRVSSTKIPQLETYKQLKILGVSYGFEGKGWGKNFTKPKVINQVYEKVGISPQSQFSPISENNNNM